MLNIRRFQNGLQIVPKTTSGVDTAGELDFDTTFNKLNLHNGTTASPVVTQAHSATLTNKILTGNIAVNLISGSGTFVLNTTGTITSPNGTSTLAGLALAQTFTAANVFNSNLTVDTNTLFVDATNHRIGILTLSPSSAVGISGQAARIIQTERNTTSNTAGNNLTVKVGGATSGATNKNGGTLILSGGLATGTGSSSLSFLVSPSGTTGTSDNTLMERLSISGTGRHTITTDAESNPIVLTSYGTGTSHLTWQQANGTATSPTKTLSGDIPLRIESRGYQQTTNGFVQGTMIQAMATQDYTSTAIGSKLEFYTTPNNSTTNALVLTLGQDQSAIFAGTMRIQSLVTAGPVKTDSSGNLTSEAQLSQTRGGTGVNNAGTLTYGSNNITLTTTGTTSLTLPTSGTINLGTDINSGAATSGQVLTANGSGGSTFTSANTNLVSPYDLSNYSIVTSVGSNAMTIALKNAAGNDPSGGDPVKISFRSSTSATGTTTQRSVTAATSIVVSSGATLGLGSNLNQFIYVYALDNSGTIELAVSGSRTFDEGGNNSTTIMNSSADLVNNLYSTTSRTGVPIRFIARITSNQTTSGTYTNNASGISLFPSDHDLQYQNNQLIYEQGNGHGSSSTRIRRFTTAVLNTTSDITFADSATLGSSFTIRNTGLYNIHYQDMKIGANATIGISVNSASVTSPIDTVTYANGGRGFTQTPGALLPGSLSTTLYLLTGDVVRAHTDGTLDATTEQTTVFNITKIHD